VAKFSELVTVSPTTLKRLSRHQALIGVHPLVWETALRLADGDRRRIGIVNHTTVIVYNHQPTE
jgi:hypothetical protein